MNRVSAAIEAGRLDARRRGYERVLRLVDLTVSGRTRPTVRRELLRWRDLAADLYLKESADRIGHRAAFRALLQMHPETARQIALLAATR